MTRNDATLLHHFRFWCQKVLPLVYDDSLSYYEVLCRVVDYINELIDQDKEFVAEIDALGVTVEQLKKELDDLLANESSKMIEIIKEAIHNVWFGLTDSGYFVAYIPESWDEIIFQTTEYDTHIDLQPEFGHLVLAFEPTEVY